ncbi:MAG: hypothetical protein KJN62_01300 [Deltaproteobacteria bacterium]|nr:hypothetical protein [Deltaproteobacteria bacterium]
MSKERRQEIVEKYKQLEDVTLCENGERIFQYYVIYGEDGLFNIVEYLSRMEGTGLRGLDNNQVDSLLNDILDDQNGYFAYKIGLMKEVVDGVIIDQDQVTVLMRFLNYLKTEKLLNQ